MVIALVVLLILLFSSVLAFGGIFIFFSVRFWLQEGNIEFLLFALGVFAVGYILCGLCIASIYKLVKSDSFKNAFMEYLKLLRFLPKVLVCFVWFGGGLRLLVNLFSSLKGLFGGDGTELRGFCFSVILAAVWLLMTIAFFKLRKKFRFGKKNAAFPVCDEGSYIYAAFPVFRAHGAPKYKNGDIYAVCVSAAAYCYCEDELVTEKLTPIYWGTKRINITKNLEEAGFEGEGIYALRVSKLSNGEDGFVLEKVLGKKEDCKSLEDIFDRYYSAPLPVSRAFGELKPDRTHELLSGNVCVGGERSDIEISIDFYKPETWQDEIDKAESCFGELSEFDGKCREYIMQELYKYADDWNDEPITRESFLERLGGFVSISISDGNYEVYYEPDGMFTDHCIAVRGSLDKGFEEALLEG